MVPAHYNGYDIMKEETKQMGLMKKLTSAIVASSLVFTLVGSASAAYTADAGNTAATRMQALKIVQGMPDGTLGLDKEITRAELVTIIVRAFGQEDNAKLLQGSAAFTDTAKHWASGNIAMAQALVAKVGGDAVGMPDGSFQPDGKLTPAQAVAFLMKFLGVKADPAKAWPANYLDKAADMGLIAADDKAMIAGQANTNSTRGLAFYLFDRAFASYQLPTGKTFYTQYVDQTAPELTVKNEATSTTMDASVTVTGTVTGASEVYVGTTKVTPDANGNFSADVALGEVKADPYTITVTARDLAGNKAEKSIQVTRTVGTAAVIEASDITVAAGATADVAVTVKDAKGNVLAGQTATGTSTVGTFADGKFTAGKTVGTGKLTLTVGTLTKDVNVTVTAGVLASVGTAAASVEPGKTVTLVAKDANGNVITGATFSQSSTDAMLDATTGTFIATKAGSYTVKATKDGVTVEGKVNVFGDVDHLVIVSPDKLIANETTEGTVTVQAVDENGNTVTSFDGMIKVDAAGLTFTDTTVRAKSGVATFTAKADAGSANTEVEIDAWYDSDASGDIDTAKDDKSTGTANVDGQVATSIALTVPTWLPTNDRTQGQNVTVNVLDQAGEYMNEGAWDMHVNLTGPGSLADNDEVTSDDVPITTASKTFAVYPNGAGESGDVNVSVSFTGMTAATGKLKAAYAQDAKSITLATSDNTATVDDTAADGNYVAYKVSLVDKNGVLATQTIDTTLSLKFSNIPDTANTFIQVQQADGTYAVAQNLSAARTVTAYKGVARFKLYGEVAGTMQVQVLPTADLAASAKSDTVFTAADPFYLGLTKTAINALQGETVTANVTAQLYDEFGNKVAKAGVPVTFSSVVDPTAVTLEKTYDGIKLGTKGADLDVDTDANGAATTAVSMKAYTDGAKIVVSSDDDNLTVAAVAGTAMTTGAKTYGATAISFVDNVPANVTVDIVGAKTTTAPRLTGWDATSAAGEGVYLRVKVTNNYGKAMANVYDDYGFSVSDSDSNWSTGVTSLSVWDETDAASGYYYSPLIQPENAGTLTLTVSLKKTDATVSASKAITVRPGAVEHAVLAEEADDMLSLATDKVHEYTVQLADEFGNLVTSSQVTEKYFVAIDSSDANASIQDANGKAITYVTVSAGRTSAKFYYVGEANDATITLSVYHDTLVTPDANKGTLQTGAGGDDAVGTDHVIN